LIGYNDGLYKNIASHFLTLSYGYFSMVFSYDFEKFSESNQLYVKGSNPGYLDITNVAKNGSTYKLTVTPSTYSAPVAWSAGNPALIVGYQGTSGDHVIERGNPGQASPLVLSSMNTVHHYTNASATTFMDISTTMLEDAVYELYFSVKGTSTANNDIVLYPNYNAGYGASAFYVSVQQFTTPGNNLIYGSGNANGFYFDLVGGYLGWDPVGKITIFNNRSAKKVTYQASDTTGVGHGSGYWTAGAGFSATSASNMVFNTATIWSNVGRLTFGPSYSSWNIWVRRIA